MIGFNTMCIKKILAYRTAIWNKQKRNVHSIFGRKEFWDLVGYLPEIYKYTKRGKR